MEVKRRVFWVLIFFFFPKISQNLHFSIFRYNVLNSVQQIGIQHLNTIKRRAQFLLRNLLDVPFWSKDQKKQIINFIQLMKSEQKAKRTLVNPCNQSSAKYQYSFSKQHRFEQNKRKFQQAQTFYDIPSTLVKRGGAISRSKRDYQRIVRTEGPAPDQYNPRTLNTKGKIIFAPGRDRCPYSSIFYNTTISYPGPGDYNPKDGEHTPQVSLAGKIKNSYQTVSPGPKYNFETSLLEKNKILSQQRKKGCIRLMPESNKSRIAKTQKSQQSSVAVVNNNEGYMSSTAKKGMGFCGVNATIGKELRFRPASAKVKIPGPGQYECFSQFIKLDHK